jgi:hypothetical protein
MGLGISDTKCSSSDSIVSSIISAINQEVAKIVNEVAKEASARVEDKIRKQTGAIAASVLEYFTFERKGSELIIRVDFSGLNKGKD